MSSPGARGGFSQVITTENLMKDRRTQPDLNQQLHLGAAKAHRGVVYSHYEYRNYNRGVQMPHGRIVKG